MCAVFLSTAGSSLGFTPPVAPRRVSHILAKDSWSVADDWNSLSSENPDNVDSQAYLNQRHMLDSYDESPSLTEEETWLEDALHTIQTNEAIDDEPDQVFEEHMGREIAYLVRCNESPEDMLVQQGRALPPLSDAERFHVGQLLALKETAVVATSFLHDAVGTLFAQHKNADGVMDGPAVARWLKKSLQSTGSVGPHDPRVNFVISQYGEYGTGYLTMENLAELYVQTMVGNLPEDSGVLDAIERYRADAVRAVWRDLRNHGILPPVEQERAKWIQEQQSAAPLAPHVVDDPSMMDECEIIEQSVASWEKDEHGQWKRHGKSSHEHVELAFDKKTPLHMKDGEFGTSAIRRENGV